MYAEKTLYTRYLCDAKLFAMRDNIGSREIRIGIAQAGSYQDTLGLGKIANIRGKVGGLWAVPPAESRGRDPGHGYGGKVPPPRS